MKMIDISRFKDLGGWTVDSQFIDQMGSAYLLAHGLGRPVADAVGRIRIGADEKGDWDEMLGKPVSQLTDAEKRRIVVAIEQTPAIALRMPDDARMLGWISGYWDGDAKTTREIVAWGKSIIPEHVSNRYIGDIETHKNSIRSILFHTRFRGPLKVLVLERLAEMLENAVLYSIGHDGDETFYNLAHRLSFDRGDGKGARDFVARVIVKETASGNRTWTVEFSNRKELTGMPTTGEAATVEVTHLKSPSTHIVLKIIYAVNAAKMTIDPDEKSVALLRVWVRTRDWVGPYGPGRFVVKIGDWTSKELGVGRSDWHWEDCGVVELPEGEVEIRLHDLTGFEGRCAGVALTEVGEAVHGACFLTSGKDSASPLRGEPYDFVVVGGGYAGLCAAVAAARQGVKTCLVHDRPVFGGNGSNEVRVGPIGRVGLKPFPRNSDLAYELMALTKGEGKTSGGLRPFFDDAKLEAWLAAEKNLTVFKNCRCIAVSSSEFQVSGFKFQEGEGIEAIEVLDVRSGERRRIQGTLFADCTGDAILAGLAGAELRTKPEEGETLKGEYGSTNFWTTRWTDHEVPFPTCPWALQIDETNCDIARPKSEVEGDYPFAAGWNWESGFGKDAIKDGEWIRDYNFRAAYGMWDYLKNHSPEKEKYAKAEMDWLGFVLGKRAARRIVGDYVLTEKDLTEHREYDDGVVTTTWFLDLHMPHPQNARHFPEGAFRSIAYDDPRYDEVGDRSKGGYKNIRPYAIPYRCFYSKNVPNLFMAGKDISATHVAMASVRVENTVAQMGAMVGRAAALCVKNGWTPRRLGAEHFVKLTELLQKPGRLTRLAKQGQGRIGVKGEVRYWMRVVYHKMKKLLGKSYLEELAG